MTGTGKIFPRNLTARAQYRVEGNPDISRPEDSVANCFPGLDLDVRNLDRRFFPGLVFEYVSASDDADAERGGALLLYLDPRGDPDLRPEYPSQLDDETAGWVEPLRATLFSQLTGAIGDQLADGDWYLDWIKQKGKQLSMGLPQPEGSAQRQDGIVVWRLVRGLEAGPVSIGLRQRGRGCRVTLKGWRRFFTGPKTGVLSLAYQPGELLMSLCSPWQHDFRDCACHYWASNRPDVVHGEADPDMLAADPGLAEIRLDWMRADRSRAGAAAALTTMNANRPFQMDHFEINRTWQDLNIVVDNTEIGSVYLPPIPENAKPYDSPEHLYSELSGQLAPLEMTLALEYLYARFSLVTRPDPQWPGVEKHAEFVRHYLLLTAISEMQHLRWANELLWSLAKAFPRLPPYRPILTPALEVPKDVRGTRPRALRPLEPAVLADFIAAEERSGTINGSYAQVTATLMRPEYPAHLSDLAGRIANDGVEHFDRFNEIRSVLAIYSEQPPFPYLRPIKLDPSAATKGARDVRDEIITNLSGAFALMAAGDFGSAANLLADSRAAMNRLLGLGETLANQGIGIPLWDE
jgi:hypothetical protein